MMDTMTLHLPHSGAKNRKKILKLHGLPGAGEEQCPAQFPWTLGIVRVYDVKPSTKSVTTNPCDAINLLAYKGILDKEHHPRTENSDYPAYLRIGLNEEVQKFQLFIILSLGLYGKYIFGKLEELYRLSPIVNLNVKPLKDSKHNYEKH